MNHGIFLFKSAEIKITLDMQINDVNESPPKKSYKKTYILMLVLFLLAMPIGLALAAAVTYLMPKKFESVAIMQVKPHVRFMEGYVSDLHVTLSPNFIANELVQIQSSPILKMAVKKLKLDIDWGLSEDVCIEILRDIVSAQSIQNTDLIEIKVRHTSQDECKDIAQAVSDAYQESRKQMSIEQTENYFMKLEEEIRKQHERVQQKDDAVERDLLERLKEKLSARIDVSPTYVYVTEHQAAVLPMIPVSPNVTLNLVCGAVGLPLLVLLFCLPISCFLLMKSQK
jgi:uncharacterized protein involved in exopolysaccharide biosynthesis